MKIVLNSVFILWLTMELFLLYATKQQEGQAMPIAMLVFALFLVVGLITFPAAYCSICGTQKRWVVYAILASLILCLNLIWVSLAHDNYNSPSNWFNWSGFIWFCGGSVTFLSILAAAFKLL